MEVILEKITAFADQAHADQKRKYAEERYIQHPLRVMKTCQDLGFPLPVLAAAILHDVLEDTDITVQQLKDFLLTVMKEKDVNRTLALVIELTDIYTKDRYPGMNRRRRKIKEADRMEKISAEAQTIKYADIIDNSKAITEHDPDFAQVYLNECKILLEKMKKGNKELRQKAIEVIDKELDQLKHIGRPS